MNESIVIPSEDHKTIHLTMVAYDMKTLTLAFVYTVLLLIGTYGNVSVIGYIQFIRRTLAQRVRQTRRNRRKGIIHILRHQNRKEVLAF